MAIGIFRMGWLSVMRLSILNRNILSALLKESPAFSARIFKGKIYFMELEE